MDFLGYVAAGAVVGFAVGLTGVGGGSLMTPLLLMFGFPVQVAIGTDLLYASITKAGGAISHHRQGNVDWKIVIALASGSLPVSVLLNVFLSSNDFHSGNDFTSILTFSLGIMLIITSIILIFKDKLRSSAFKNRPGYIMGPIHKNPLRSTVLMGVVLGICVTLSSVGAGAFGAAILLVIHIQLSAVKVVGTDVAHAVPLTFIAGLGYLYNGYVDAYLLLSLLIGSLPAIYIGSRVSNKVPEKILQKILIGLLMVLGLNYAFF